MRVDAGENRTGLLCAAALLVGLLILLGTFRSPFAWAALALAAGAIAMLEPGDGLCLMVFWLGMANIFKAGPGQPSFFTYLVFLYGIRGIAAEKTASPWVIAFSLYAVLLSLLTGHTDAAREAKLISGVVLIDLMNGGKSRMEPERVCLFYLAGTLTSSAMAFLDSDVFRIAALSATKELGLHYGFGQVLRFSGLDTDPNYYSVNLILSMCAAVYLYDRRRLGLAQVTVILGLCAGLVILTYSKSAFLMLLLPMALLLSADRRAGRRAGITLALSLLGAAALGAALGFSFRIVRSRLAAGSADVNALTTGRIEIWGGYLRHLIGHPAALLFGAGAGAPLVGQRVTHSTYLEMVYHFGIVGSALLLPAIWPERREAAGSLCARGALIGLLILYGFLSEVFYYDAPFQVLLALLMLRGGGRAETAPRSKYIR